MEYDTTHQLRRELVASGIDVSVWGAGVTKQVKDLAAEIDAGESIVMLDEKTGEIVRFVEGVALDVYASNETGTYHLIEDRQEFSNGAVRNRYLSTSLGEKMLPEEVVNETVCRALREELGVVATKAVRYGQMECIVRASQSYPCVTSVLHLHRVAVEISEDEFCAEGYAERQRDKTTYFTWSRVANNSTEVFRGL